MRMTPKGIITIAYVLAGLTPGSAAFLFWITGWAIFKGIAIVGLIIFIGMAVVYATSDKADFKKESERIQKQWDEEDREREEN